MLLGVDPEAAAAGLGFATDLMKSLDEWDWGVGVGEEGLGDLGAGTGESGWMLEKEGWDGCCCVAVHLLHADPVAVADHVESL